ncbi:hypothetical protein [Candidatus Poriferisocius sp.]|uniref:hypothetical protein n=1 Tax=Candidatus Poriferisocius sp. TaxID=3101276 RepID=UPI003B01C76D
MSSRTALRPRSSGPPRRMRRRRGGLAVLCAAAVAATTMAGSTAGATGPTYQPAAGFADAGYSVPHYAHVWSDLVGRKAESSQSVSYGMDYLAQVAMVERDGSGLDLSFAVEGQAGPSFQNCHPDHGCTDAMIGVTSEGLLYLRDRWLDASKNRAYLGEFASRAVELSATDADSGLKVYREVAVDPPAEAAGCEDYGDDTPEAFTCLFLRQLLPAGQAASADEAALRAKLPKLVQDSSNYRLVFAEEFNGTPPPADANGCRDGLSTLDAAVWNYPNTCNNVDSRGEPCGNVADGGFTMGVAGTCPSAGFIIHTGGHLHMKYGYIEFKYTVNMDHWQAVYDNFNLILHAGGSRLPYQRERYGIEANDWEDHLKTTEVEIDIFEHSNGNESTGTHANWQRFDSELTPLSTTKRVRFCRRDHDLSEFAVAEGHRFCHDRDSFTVTRGFEWTPRGYRTFIKIDGTHNDLVLAPQNRIYIERHHTDGSVRVRGDDPAADQYFEYLVPGDNGSLLELAGVGHVPLPLNVNVWSFLDADKHPYIRRRMTFDYVRVWQPENHYADMEPVYQ